MLSRTAHHVPFDHWNEREQIEWRPGASYDQPVSHTVWDLRFYAGCRRTPKLIRARVRFGGYLHGHGGTSAAGVNARDAEAGMRAAARNFGELARRVHRAGGDVQELLEPEGRHRHGVLWEIA